MRQTHDKNFAPAVRDSVGIAGCDPAALVRVSEQFAELELEVLRRSEVTAAQIAAERQDWAQVGVSMGHVYQALCDGDSQKAMDALDAIAELLGKRGILIPKPTLRQAAPAATPTEESLPMEPSEEEVTDGQQR